MDVTKPEVIEQSTTVPPRKLLFMDTWNALMGMCIFSRGAYIAQQFRGYPPRGLGARAAARSRGFSNVKHEARALWARGQREAAAPC